jgi:ketosteroid isomerase-like protein
MMRRPLVCAVVVALAAGFGGCGPEEDHDDTAELTKLTRTWMAAVADRDAAAICRTYAHSGDGPEGCVAAVRRRLRRSALAEIPPAVLRKGFVSVKTGGSCCVEASVVTTGEPDFRRSVLLLDSENPGNSYLVAQDPLCGSRECGRAR